MKTYSEMLAKYQHLSFQELLELVAVLEDVASHSIEAAGWSGSSGNWPLQDSVATYREHMAFIEQRRRFAPLFDWRLSLVRKNDPTKGSSVPGEIDYEGLLLSEFDGKAPEYPELHITPSLIPIPAEHQDAHRAFVALPAEQQARIVHSYLIVTLGRTYEGSSEAFRKERRKGT